MQVCELKNLSILLLFLYILIFIFIYLNYYKTINNNNNNIENFQTIEDSLALLLNPQHKNKLNIQTETYNNELIKKNDDLMKIKNSDSDISNKLKKEKEKEKEIKYIYVLPQHQLNDHITYLFYNKFNKNYLKLKFYNKSNIFKMFLYNIHDNQVGKLLYYENNKYIFKLDFFNDKNLNIDFYNEYKETKIYFDNDDKFFYIKESNKNKEYNIYLFNKLIGKIDFNRKIFVFDEYKDYLNIFGITYILMDNIKNNL
jgi:hypothetical protein